MTKPQINEDILLEADAAAPAETQSVPPPVTAPAAPDAETRVAELEKQLSEMKDRALREMADAENTRRRAKQEKEEISKYAVASLAKEMLPIADNFRRAVEAAPKDVSDPAVKNLITGVEATERQLQGALERVGIKKLEPVGQMFDPNLHQVMMEVDSPDQPAGTIVQVLQAGYMIHDRLLREALVAVAKGGKSAVVAPVDTSA